MSFKEKVNRRTADLGRLIVECQTQALQYGSCVSLKENITKHACEKEFQALKACIKQVAKKTKS
ncbi:hypothetical protein ABFA07_021644 [Porites harrisoni]